MNDAPKFSFTTSTGIGLSVEELYSSDPRPLSWLRMLYAVLTQQRERRPEKAAPKSSGEDRDLPDALRWA